MQLNSCHPTQSYFENNITTSDPVDLIRELYRATIESIRNAQLAIMKEDIQERNRHITKAQRIIGELATSLMPEHAPELCLRLAQIYEYSLHLIQQGHFTQTTPPLREAQSLMETLLEGWIASQEASSLLSQEAFLTETVSQ